MSVLKPDLLLIRAQRVTAREKRTEQFWLRAVLGGFPREADRIQTTGYDAEHYMAALSEVPEQITEEQKERLAMLEVEADGAIADFLAKQRQAEPRPPADDRDIPR